MFGNDKFRKLRGRESANERSIKNESAVKFKIAKKLPLHYQIIIALFLGALFGGLFNAERDGISVIIEKDGTTVKKEIDKVVELKIFLLDSSGKKKTLLKKFAINAVSGAAKYFERLKPEEKSRAVVEITSASKKRLVFYSPLALEKNKTLPMYLKPVGDIFVRLLSLLAIPLVIASLIVGASSLKNVKELGSIGAKTLLIYIATTAIAITIGLAAANLIEPGKRMDEKTKAALKAEYSNGETVRTEALRIDVVNFFVETVPKNPFKAIAEGKMLQIVFFSVLFGSALIFVEKDKAKKVIDFFDGVSSTMIKIVEGVMKLAPYGVFALVGATLAEFGFGAAGALIWYILVVVLALAIHLFVVYPVLLKLLAKRSPKSFFKGVRDAQVLAFSVSSSAAALPVTFECVEKNLGISKRVSSFVLPLGATINMDGTALYQGVAAVFIAQVYGMDLNLSQQLTVILTAVLASIGTAPAPGVGIIMLVMILQAINVPAEGIALIIGVDRILDMLRTSVNVTGDATVAAIIDRSDSRQNEVV